MAKVYKAIILFLSPCILPSLCPAVVHHVLGGGQPDDEEVQDDEEPGRVL